MSDRNDIEYDCGHGLMVFALKSCPYCEIARLTQDLAAMTAERGINGSTSDGYHTFDELYDHRCHLFTMLMWQMPSLAWRADKNDDGAKWEGWFLAGINLPTGTITYHLPQTMWDMLDGITTYDRGLQWDGHTSSDVITRLSDAILLRTQFVDTIRQQTMEEICEMITFGMMATNVTAYIEDLLTAIRKRYSTGGE